jgi:hypothetical protein
VPIAVAPEAVRSPYAVEIVADDGDTLDTFFHKGRYYVRGAANRAYTIRVSNPTPHRIEAVVSVDGLDVIDGESGDLRKRGYIVPPYGEVRIEGWRTSLENVAAFRFSSVGASYAGRKGKARNVGVIAVALFAEEAPAMIVTEPSPYYDDGYGEDVDRYLDRRWRPAPTGGARGQAQTRAGEGAKASRPAPPPVGSVRRAGRRVRRRPDHRWHCRRAGRARAATTTRSATRATAAASAPSASAWAPSTASRATRRPVTRASSGRRPSRSRSPSCATTTTPA